MAAVADKFYPAGLGETFTRNRKVPISRKFSPRAPVCGASSGAKKTLLRSLGTVKGSEKPSTWSTRRAAFLLVGAGPSAPSVETFRNIFGHV